MLDESKKIVWAYMLEYGHQTDGEYSYYGGDYSQHGSDYSGYGDEKRDIFLNKVRTIGVDWNLTNQPSSNKQSCFEGTFDESSEAEFLLGTLVLNNGESFLISAKDENGMSSYIKKVLSLTKDKERVASIFGDRAHGSIPERVVSVKLQSSTNAILESKE